MRCAACDHPDQGYAHTCAGSGTFLAAEFEPDIDEIAQTWGYFQVRLSFRTRAADEIMVREKLNPLVTKILDDDLVAWGEFTVEQEPDE